jgi:ribosomal protein S8
MSVSVALFFASLYGGSLGRRKYVRVPASRETWLLCEKFYKAGYISSFFLGEDPVFKIWVRLKYFPSGLSVLENLDVVTKSSQRNYISYQQVEKLFRTRRRAFLMKTTLGYLWSSEVRNMRIGGELVCFL